MSKKDEKKAETAAKSGAEAQMQAPSLLINAQYIKDLSFENPNAPAIFAQQGAPKIDVNVDVGAKKVGDDSYEIVLVMKATATASEKTAFIVELAYAGVFTIQGIQEAHLEPVVLIECPRMLFPFARNVLATVTREAGFPPLMINPIDFGSLYLQQKQAQKQAAAEAKTARKN